MSTRRAGPAIFSGGARVAVPRAKRRSSRGRFGNVAHCSDSFRGDSRLPPRDCVGASPDKSREAKQGPLARFQTSRKAAKCEPQLHPDCDVAAGFSVPGTTISGQEERAASHVFFCFFFFFFFSFRQRASCIPGRPIARRVFTRSILSCRNLRFTRARFFFVARLTQTACHFRTVGMPRMTQVSRTKSAAESACRSRN